MLKQVAHWLLIAENIGNAILLLRFFGLRLHRLYAFIALDVVLSVFYDAISLSLGVDSEDNLRIRAYSRLLVAVLTPFIAWDVFEEAKTQIAKLRRIEGVRMLAALVVIGLSAAMLTFLLSVESETPPLLAYIEVVGVFLVGGATLAAFVFLWKVRRAVRKQGLPLPRNTSVWSIYYLLTFAVTLVDSAIFFAQIKLSDTAVNSINLLFSLYSLACTLWCALKIKPVETPEQSAVTQQ